MKQIQTLFTLLLAAIILTSCHEDTLYPAGNFSTTGFVQGYKWVLDASGSVSPNGKKLQYRWDYDEDQSEYDTPWSNNPVYISVANSNTNYIKVVSLQVMDEDGLTTTVSKEVYKNDFMHYFRSNTLYYNNLEITYNSYHWIENSRSKGGDWTVKNYYSKSSIGITNTADSLSNGSYMGWESAIIIKPSYLSFILPTKENWEGLIKLCNGYDLAGFNLQVKNLYGMGLGLHGYIANNQLLENTEKGFYWTASEVDSAHAWAVEISKNSDTVRFVSLPKSYQCKVRIIYPIPND